MNKDFTNSAILEQKDFMTKVYGFMSFGLFITAIISFVVSHSQTMLNFIFGNPFSYWILFFLEIGIVSYFSAKIKSLDMHIAVNLFVAYSILNGLTLSFIYIAYTKSSIASAFFSTSIMFIIMSLYGTVTKKDLTSIGSFMSMGLIGIIIATIINIFMRSSLLDLMISIIGIIVFTGLTAYDTQKIKSLVFYNSNSEEDKKSALLGALILYLDFINLFLMILRFLGSRRRD